MVGCGYVALYQIYNNNNNNNDNNNNYYYYHHHLLTHSIVDPPLRDPVVLARVHEDVRSCPIQCDCALELAA